jgi:hypothetical protein
MKIEKDKRKVCIICEDGTLVTGTVHINPGERLLDFFNDQKETFIPVTESEVCNPEEKDKSQILCKKKDTIILNKTSIKFVEEL